MSRLNFTRLLLPAFGFAVACARVDSINSPTVAAPTDGVILSGRSVNLTASVAGAVPSPAGLKACFAGETNANDVVSNNVGALTGGANFAAGRFGQAFDFHALGDGVTVPINATLNVGPGAGITMAAWIFPRGTSYGGAPGAGPIMEFEGGAHMWQHQQTGGDFGLFTNLAEGTSSAQYHILQIAGVAVWGTWQHVAVTYSKATATITLYRNGVAVGSAAAGSFSPFTNTPLRIGRRVVQFLSDPEYAFNGVIDEVQLYDRGLTTAEVGQLASATGTMCVPPPASYQVMQMPVGSGESGVPFTTQPSVVILDAAGNIVSNATTAVTATASGGGTLTGTVTVNAVNGIATFTNLAIAGAATTTVSFGAGSLPVTGGPATSGALTTVQVARKLGITTQPGGAQSGSALVPQPVIQVRDAAGLQMPGATNVITAAVASGVGTVGGTTTATAVNANATFAGLTVNGVGIVTLSFASPGLTGITSNPLTLAALPSTQIGLLTQPSGAAESGIALPTQPVVEIRNAAGARATTATGTVTAVIASGAGGTLAGTTTATVVNGLATFSNLQLNGPGTFTLRFTYSTLPAITSANVVVTQVVRNLVVVTGPASIITGVIMSPPYTVELRDAAGIKVANAALLVRMGYQGGVGALTGAIEVRSVAGVVTFPGVAAVPLTASTQFQFWVVEPGPLYASAYGLSGLVTVLANNTVPPFDWKGFSGDIDAPPKYNKVDAGDDVEIKFSLNGNKGLDIFAAGYPATQAASCTTWAVTGTITAIKVKGTWDNDDDDDDDDYVYDHDYGHCGDKSHHKDHRHKVSHGGGWSWGNSYSSSTHSTTSSNDAIKSALRYSDGKYRLTWDTDKSWKNTCRVLLIKLTDGTTHAAYFKFTD